jgi:hypothetical protein
MDPYIASTDTEPGYRFGRAVVYRGSEFIAECRSLDIARKIAELLNEEAR